MKKAAITPVQQTLQMLQDHLEWYEQGLLPRLPDVEVVALVLSGGKPSLSTLALAATMLEHYDLADLCTIEPYVFCAEFGLSVLQARRLMVIRLLASKWHTFTERPLHLVDSSECALFLQPFLSHLDHEEMWVLGLDHQLHLQFHQRVFVGTVNTTAIRVPELFRMALIRKSLAIVVAHNHPSGTCDPSEEDIEMTRSIIAAGKTLQIDVLDHLILTHQMFLSLRQHLAEAEW